MFLVLSFSDWANSFIWPLDQRSASIFLLRFSPQHKVSSGSLLIARLRRSDRLSVESIFKCLPDFFPTLHRRTCAHLAQYKLCARRNRNRKREAHDEWRQLRYIKILQSDYRNKLFLLSANWESKWKGLFTKHSRIPLNQFSIRDYVATSTDKTGSRDDDRGLS